MISSQDTSSALSANLTANETTMFGVPIGRFGLFFRVVMSGAFGFISFFIAFVCAIIGVSIYDSVTGTSLTNLDIAYLYFAAPVGILVMMTALTYLIAGWARRKMATGK